jgi:sulfite exporter TauE/SafE
MAASDYFRTIKQKLTSDSASWGSLLMLALGVTTLVILMVRYSHG